MEKEQLEKVELKGFENPEEVRKFPNGYIELIKIGDATVGRTHFEPGWKWSTSVKPIVGTESCQQTHLSYHVAGVLKIKMDDGREFESKPGEVSFIPPGHDAWVVGNETVVIIDFQGMADYAKPHYH